MGKLRQAVITDLPQMIALDRTIFGAYGADESPTVIAARLEVFPAGCVVLEENAEDEAQARLVGYLTTEKWDALRAPALDEDPRKTHKSTGTVLNITTLAIAPQQQKRGLGTQLVTYSIALAEREACTSIILETAQAEQFYRRYGFVKIGERIQRTIVLHIMLYTLTKT